MRGGHTGGYTVGGCGRWKDGIGKSVRIFADTLDVDVEAFVGLVADESGPSQRFWEGNHGA